MYLASPTLFAFYRLKIIRFLIINSMFFIVNGDFLTQKALIKASKVHNYPSKSTFYVIHPVVPAISIGGNCRFHRWKRSFPPVETHRATARMEVYGCLIYNIHKVIDNKSIK